MFQFLLIYVLVFPFTGLYQPDNIAHSACLSSVSKKNTAFQKGSNNQYIYDFMKIVIADQKLDLNFCLKIKPDREKNDTAHLNHFLLDEKEVEKIPGTLIPKVYESWKCLTKAEVQEMLLQRETFINFEWDNERLKFNPENKKNWYYFSVPLFSADKNKALVNIMEFCDLFMCGSGKTLLYEKENDHWKARTITSWYH